MNSHMSPYSDSYGKDLHNSGDHERKTHKVKDYDSEHDKHSTKTHKSGKYGDDTDIPKTVSKNLRATSHAYKVSTPLCVDVVAGGAYKDCSVVAYGRDVHTITDHERKTYKIEEHSLKHAFGDYFGKVPDDAYLCSPTPYGDLYKRFGWEQVKVTLIPVSAEVLECETQKTVVKSLICKNYKYKPQLVDVSLCETVCNSVTKVWTSHYDISCGQCIKYNISFSGTGGWGESGVEFKHAFGKDKTEYQDVTIGSPSGTKVTLQPHESVEARLLAYYGSMKVKVTYRATISGGYAVSYNQSYKDKDFWCVPVTGVLKGCGVETTKFVEEILDVNYFSGSYVELRDPECDEVKRVIYGTEHCATDCY